MVIDERLITEMNSAKAKTMTNNDLTQETITCSKSTIETLEKDVKYAQS